MAVKSGATILSGYGYDALGRRISESHPGVTTTDLYLSQAGQVLEEQQAGQTNYWYVWSPVYQDALVVRQTQYAQAIGPGGGGGPGGDSELSWTGFTSNGLTGPPSLDTLRQWAVQDANWNVTAVVGDDTAGPGPASVTERYAYDPYGQVSFLTAAWAPAGTSTVNWQYLHQGLRWDTAAGLYDDRARAYSPTLMRFLQNDPTQFNAGDPNFYRYVGDSPGNATDPCGLIWDEPVGHHWVPVNVAKDFWNMLSNEAKSWHAGDWSGPLKPGVHAGSHPRYDEVVRAELKEYISKNGITAANKMSKDQMKEFAQMMRDGQSVLGKSANSKILKEFNIEIIAAMKTKPAQEEAAILRRGSDYRKNSGRYVAFAAIAGVIGVLTSGSAMASELGTISESKYFKEALYYGKAGDLASVRAKLIGNPDDDPMAPTHLFGQIASELTQANQLQRNAALVVHQKLVEYFNELERFRSQAGK